MTSAPSPTPLPTGTDDYDAYVDPLRNVTYDYENYTDTFTPINKPSPLCIDQAECVTMVVVNVTILLLGLLGNGLVIWVIGFNMKKRRTVITTWYLSLALSDFIFCATLPFSVVPQVTGSWNFGLFMCKFSSFVLFLNMFSSIFLMLIISVDRCVSVVYGVWARTNRTTKRAAVVVVVAWLLSVLLSIPSLVVRDLRVREHNQVECYNNFETLPFSSTSVTVFRFVLGFVFPLVIITVCYSIIIKTIQNHSTLATSTKAFKILTALIVTFVICWLPYHIFMLLDPHFKSTDLSHNRFITTGTLISVALVHANSCMNPFLYAFMGSKDIKQNVCDLISKMENALSEESSQSSMITPQSSTNNVQPRFGTSKGLN